MGTPWMLYSHCRPCPFPGMEGSEAQDCKSGWDWRIGMRRLLDCILYRNAYFGYCDCSNRGLIPNGKISENFFRLPCKAGPFILLEGTPISDMCKVYWRVGWDPGWDSHSYSNGADVYPDMYRIHAPFGN